MMELQILIVEDDDLQRKVLYDLLTGWGHTVLACMSLFDARDLIGKHTFDLTLLDMRLPDGDGLEFLEEQKSGGNSSNIVIMTAFADVKTAVGAIRLGAYDYLPKPFEHEQLEKIIRNLSKRVELSGQVTSLSMLTSSDYKNVWQFDGMIGSQELRLVFEKAERVAGFSDTTVLILGETGTGKGMLAKSIHRRSGRAEKPFVEINCSAIPGQLIESEIFGYEKGAFTDAKNRKTGLLEVADGGTVFLDEIGDMEISLQSKLLKVLEDKEFRRLGSSKITSVDIRILAATSRDLKKMMDEGTFREDLYYRLSVVPVTMPPLRTHKDSIVPLADHYLGTFAKEMGRNIKKFSKEANLAMQEYSWPGNVRELRNVIERSVILCGEGEIDIECLGISERNSVFDEKGSDFGDNMGIKPMSLAECEKKLIESVLNSVNGNKNRAAEILQIHRTTLYKKIEEYGVS